MDNVIYILVEHDDDNGPTNIGGYRSKAAAEEAMAEQLALNEAVGDDPDGSPLSYEIDEVPLF